MFDRDRERFTKDLADIRSQGLWKEERVIQSPQGARIQSNGKEVLCLCANNYLGLANDPTLRAAAKAAIDSHGLGLASVRFICGTQDIHKTLEKKVSAFLGTEDTILYSSCFDANGGLFETIMGEQDAIISDSLNHASIIDGIRLSKAQRFRYQNGDMQELEQHLQATQGCRSRLIATDGVFSMDGYIAKLPEILQIAREEGAIVVMDDSHATGVLGATGRGTAEHFGVLGEVDIITSTLGKALGGAAGGFIAGPAALCDIMTQRSRPQLFSNALPPTVAASALAAVEFTEAHPERVTRLHENTRYFRAAIEEAGFAPLPGETPIVPIIVGETALAIRMSELLLDRGVFVTGFGFPVVPQGQARVRCQVSAAHTTDDLDRVVEAFRSAGRVAGLLK